VAKALQAAKAEGEAPPLLSPAVSLAVSAAAAAWAAAAADAWARARDATAAAQAAAAIAALDVEADLASIDGLPTRGAAAAAEAAAAAAEAEADAAAALEAARQAEGRARCRGLLLVRLLCLERRGFLVLVCLTHARVTVGASGAAFAAAAAAGGGGGGAAEAEDRATVALVEAEDTEHVFRFASPYARAVLQSGLLSELKAKVRKRILVAQQRARVGRQFDRAAAAAEAVASAAAATAAAPKKKSPGLKRQGSFGGKVFETQPVTHPAAAGAPFVPEVSPPPVLHSPYLAELGHSPYPALSLSAVASSITAAKPTVPKKSWWPAVLRLGGSSSAAVAPAAPPAAPPAASQTLAAAGGSLDPPRVQSLLDLFGPPPAYPRGGALLRLRILDARSGGGGGSSSSEAIWRRSSHVVASRAGGSEPGSEPGSSRSRGSASLYGLGYLARGGRRNSVSAQSGVSAVVCEGPLLLRLAPLDHPRSHASRRRRNSGSHDRDAVDFFGLGSDSGPSPWVARHCELRADLSLLVFDSRRSPSPGLVLFLGGGDSGDSGDSDDAFGGGNFGRRAPIASLRFPPGVAAGSLPASPDFSHESVRGGLSARLRSGPWLSPPAAEASSPLAKGAVGSFAASMSNSGSGSGGSGGIGGASLRRVPSLATMVRPAVRAAMVSASFRESAAAGAEGSSHRRKRAERSAAEAAAQAAARAAAAVLQVRCGRWLAGDDAVTGDGQLHFKAVAGAAAAVVGGTRSARAPPSVVEWHGHVTALLAARRRRQRQKRALDKTPFARRQERDESGSGGAACSGRDAGCDAGCGEAKAEDDARVVASSEASSSASLAPAVPPTWFRPAPAVLAALHRCLGAFAAAVGGSAAAAAVAAAAEAAAEAGGATPLSLQTAPHSKFFGPSTDQPQLPTPPLFLVVRVERAGNLVAARGLGVERPFAAVTLELPPPPPVALPLFSPTFLLPPGATAVAVGAGAAGAASAVPAVSSSTTPPRTVAQRTACVAAPTLHAAWRADVVFDLTRDAAPFFAAHRTQAATAAAVATASGPPLTPSPSALALANAAAGDSSRPQAAAAAVEAAALAAFLAGVAVEAAVWHAGHAGGPDTKTATTATPHAPAGASPGAAVALVEAGAGAAAVAGSNAPRLLPLATLQPYAYAPAPARARSTGSGSGGWTFLGPALRPRAAAGLQPITAPAGDGSGVRAPLIQVPLYRTTTASARLPSGLGAGSVGGRSGARSSEADVLASLPGSALILGAAVFVGAVPSCAVAETPTKALNQPTRRGSF
jgi:hypothetical protein